jgi:hypothetical protein
MLIYCIINVVLVYTFLLSNTRCQENTLQKNIFTRLNVITSVFQFQSVIALKMVYVALQAALTNVATQNGGRTTDTLYKYLC